MEAAEALPVEAAEALPVEAAEALPVEAAEALPVETIRPLASRRVPGFGPTSTRWRFPATKPQHDPASGGSMFFLDVALLLLDLFTSKGEAEILHGPILNPDG
jgi:hypothetical protein